MMLEMDKVTVKDYIYQLGFGEPSGIDLPFEIGGLLKNLDTRRDIEYANVSFGQGIAVTPISIVRGISVIANGGDLVTPHVVEKIQFKSGLSKDIEYAREEEIFSEETTDTITQMLVELVDESYKDDYPTLETYNIAAKTGTAQIANPEGGYYEDRNLHSFVGYFPAFDPEFIIFYYLVFHLQ